MASAKVVGDPSPDVARLQVRIPEVESDRCVVRSGVDDVLKEGGGFGEGDAGLGRLGRLEFDPAVVLGLGTGEVVHARGAGGRAAPHDDGEEGDGEPACVHARPPVPSEARSSRRMMAFASSSDSVELPAGA